METDDHENDKNGRISSFQWNVNTLHNDVVSVCPSGEINNTSLAQIHNYMVPQIQSLYSYENVFCFLFFFANHMQ